jgi:hypothetical protein
MLKMKTKRTRRKVTTATGMPIARRRVGLPELIGRE